MVQGRAGPRAWSLTPRLHFEGVNPHSRLAGYSCRGTALPELKSSPALFSPSKSRSVTCCGQHWENGGCHLLYQPSSPDTSGGSFPKQDPRSSKPSTYAGVCPTAPPSGLWWLTSLGDTQPHFEGGSFWEKIQVKWNLGWGWVCRFLGDVRGVGVLGTRKAPSEGLLLMGSLMGYDIMALQ